MSEENALLTAPVGIKRDILIIIIFFNFAFVLVKCFTKQNIINEDERGINKLRKRIYGYIHP